MPSFELDTVALGDQYSTRLFPTPTANLSFSGPGVHYVGIYGAWNGGFVNLPRAVDEKWRLGVNIAMCYVVRPLLVCRLVGVGI